VTTPLRAGVGGFKILHLLVKNPFFLSRWKIPPLFHEYNVPLKCFYNVETTSSIKRMNRKVAICINPKLSSTPLFSLNLFLANWNRV
jgi:hypothetical protein